MTSFPMPIGPKADLAELEYIAALHQTSFPMLRSDASISSSDISLFLRSRYGLQINEEAALDIVRGLGGTQGRRCGNISYHENVIDVSDFEANQEEEAGTNNKSVVHETGHSENKSKEGLRGHDEEYLDMVQWVTALFIPTIVKVSNEANSSEILDSEISDIHQELNGINYLSTDGFASFIQKILHKKQSQHELRFAKDKQSLKIDERIITIAFQNLMGSLGVEGDGLREEVVLTKDFVRTLLLIHGETFHNDDLLQQMVDCTAPGQDEGVENPRLFHTSSFISALTHDINEYDCGVEDKLSTTFFDIFEFEPIEMNKNTTTRDAPPRCSLCDYGEDEEDRFCNCKSIDNSPSDVLSSSEQSSEHKKLHRDSIFHGRSKYSDVKPNFDYISPAPYIDYVVDSQQGVVFLMFLWVYFLFSVMVYMTFINAYAYNIFECSPTFACELGNRIWSWMCLGVILSIGGIVLMAPISMANDPYKVGFRRATISATFILGFTFLPYAGISGYRAGIPHGPNNQLTDIERLVSSRWVKTATDIYLSFGIFLLATSMLRHLIGILISRDEQESIGTMKRWFLSRDVTGSAGIKQAATRKINRLLQNVIGLHVSGHEKNVYQRFLSSAGQVKHCGGIVWTWKQLFNGNKLLQDHGVWIHSRLAVGQEGQIIVYAFIIGLMTYETDILAREANDLISRVQHEEAGPLKTLLLSYLPAGWIIRRSFITGIGFAGAIGIVLILVYLPSTVSTILQLRSGVLPSIHDKNFHKYRYSADTTFYNVGNMVFGLAGSMFLFFTFFGGLVFLCLWQITKDSMILFLAWFTGLMITILLHYLITRIFRKKFYTSFYRQQPRAGNFSALAMECWHIGLGGGVLVGRLTQFLLASAFWIGRIDVSFLHDDVHIFGYRFDTAPANFRKEILVHEAHRHPYIDRLCSMYLTRLRHGPNFCSDAGCAWRRLFVLALMPWLKKYRRGHTKEEEKFNIAKSSERSGPESDVHE